MREQVVDALQRVAANWEEFAWALGLLVVAALVGLLLHRLLFTLLPHLLRRTPLGLDDALIRRLRRPSRWLFPLLGLRAALATLTGQDTRWVGDVGQAVTIAVILTMTWAAIATVRAVGEWLRSRHDITATDNLQARRIHTQVDVLATTFAIVIAMVGGAIALMQFPQVRELGASLLASAGIAGIVVGLAARPVLSNLIAGVQLAFSEPIRLDDVVVVEGEWGRVEDITSAYVVVKIWDERRLVLPVSYFLEHPFQNWTRETAQVLGTVFLHLDWRVPVDRIRTRLKELCEANENWDGRAVGVQVTGTSAEAVEVRCLVSAADASRLWTLRCDVREGLVEFLQAEYPESLPVLRAEVRRVGEEREAGEERELGEERQVGNERQVGEER